MLNLVVTVTELEERPFAVAWCKNNHVEYTYPAMQLLNLLCSCS